VEKLLGAARTASDLPSSVQTDSIPVFYAQTQYSNLNLRDAGLQALKTSHATLFHLHNTDNLTAFPVSCPSILPAPHDSRLAKKYPSPFFGTNLATQLATLGIDTLLIAGFATSGSVRSAVIDAMQSGFRPMVVMEGCGDLGTETHWANLMDMNAKYGDVVDLKSALEVIHQRRGSKK
jgi:hypothetical protein